MSPQIASMNWLFMLREAQKMNPGFWFEISTWDGHTADSTDKRRYYVKIGQAYGPERYQGSVQFGMWLLRPRVVREYRGWTETVRDEGPYFLAVVDAVDRVYSDATLQRFWRKASLVANDTGQHPYQSSIPAEYGNVRRWFLLDTDVNPPRPWTLSTRISVFSLALVLGSSPTREWLLYAHSPARSYSGVKVTIPGYGEVTIDVTQAGCFYDVVEQGRAAKRLY